MLFLTRWFGVTGSDSERNLAREKSEIEEIAEKALLLQSNAAAQQHRPLCRGTHAKGVCARAQFEVFDVTVKREPALAARLAEAPAEIAVDGDEDADDGDAGDDEEESVEEEPLSELVERLDTTVWWRPLMRIAWTYPGFSMRR